MFPQKVHKNDMRALFNYLAKAEGRKKVGFVPADATPMINNEGHLVLSIGERVQLITDTFYKRFSAPAEINPTINRHDPNDVPLAPFRERIVDDFHPVQMVEVVEAVKSLTGNRAPGPDGITATPLHHLPALYPYLQALYNAIYLTGRIPAPMCQLNLVPLPKPGKDPRLPSNKRPISLLNTMVKVMEAIMYHRILPIVEPQLTPFQFAYRRSRGTEDHLTSLVDKAHRSLLNGSFVYIISFDIEAAFGRVPHWQITRALKRMHIDGYTRRLIHNWLKGRTFTLKQRTPQGIFYGPKKSITCGLPQGGVLSPCLWNMVFNDVPQRLQELRDAQRVPRTAFLDLVYADDFTTLITSSDLHLLKKFFTQNIHNLERVIGLKHLILSMPKTHNILLEPHLVPRGTYRRGPPHTTMATKTRLRLQRTHEARFDISILEYNPLGPPGFEALSQAAGPTRGFPYPLSDTVRILGILLDSHQALDDHFASLLKRSQLRQGLLAQVARKTWGLNTTVWVFWVLTGFVVPDPYRCRQITNR